MRNFAIVLGCFAWVLSCFVAVSDYRAGEQRHAAELRLKNATASAATATAFAGQDSAHLQQRLKRDQAVVDSDNLALQKTQNRGAGDAQDRQTLAADRAALQADQLMQYTFENFARNDPDPKVVAAENRVDVDRRLLADAVATRNRNRTLAHALLALWALVAGAAFLAFRAHSGEEFSTPDTELEPEEDLDGDEDLVEAEDVKR